MCFAQPWCKAHRNWKAIDMKVTDAANESKDNVKYLTTLEKSLEPMYVGGPQAGAYTRPLFGSTTCFMWHRGCI
jgi:hypothetical protein